MRAAPAPLVLLLLPALLAGCSAPAAREPGPLVGNLAPGFAVQPVDADNATFRLEDQRGKVLLLDLMGVNCEPCREEMPHLLAVSAAHRNQSGYAQLSVDMASVYPGLGARSLDDIRSFKQGFNATWPFAPDSGHVGRDYEPIALPTLLVIDREGVIRWRAGGGNVDEDALGAQLAAAGLGG